MRDLWQELDIIERISNEELKDKVKKTWEIAMQRGGWDNSVIFDIPFTLLIPGCPVSLVEHTKQVTEMALECAERMDKAYDQYHFDRDILIAGGLLHDVGKLLEYEKDGDSFIKSVTGKHLRHPFSGAALAWEIQLPTEVVHIIATHAHEGDKGWRSLEAIVVNKCDFINFDSLRSILGTV